MKFFFSTLLIAVISFAAGLYLPWWSMALVSFSVTAFLPQRPLYAFLCGFVAIFILWIAMAFFISHKNDNILAHKISMLILKTDSPASLILLTGLIGALVAGFAALSASYLRQQKIKQA